MLNFIRTKDAAAARQNGQIKTTAYGTGGQPDKSHMIIETGSSNRSTLNSLDRVRLSEDFGARKNVWSRQGSKFKVLHDEEDRIVQQRTANSSIDVALAK